MIWDLRNFIWLLSDIQFLPPVPISEHLTEGDITSQFTSINRSIFWASPCNMRKRWLIIMQIKKNPDKTKQKEKKQHTGGKNIHLVSTLFCEVSRVYLIDRWCSIKVSWWFGFVSLPPPSFWIGGGGICTNVSLFVSINSSKELTGILKWDWNFLRAMSTCNPDRSISWAKYL